MIESKEGSSVENEQPLLNLAHGAGKTTEVLTHPRNLTSQDKETLLEAITFLGELQTGYKDEIDLSQLTLKTFKESLSWKERRRFKGERKELLVGLEKFKEVISFIHQGEPVKRFQIRQVGKFFDSLQTNLLLKAFGTDLRRQDLFLRAKKVLRQNNLP